MALLKQEMNLKVNQIIWVDQGREFYKSPMQKWLEDNILMYLTHNEGLSIVAYKNYEG